MPRNNQQYGDMPPFKLFVHFIKQIDKRDRDWMQDANCKDKDPHGSLFFPEAGHNPSDFVKICNNCDVKMECLSYAMLNNIAHGVWGGLTSKQRFKLRRKIYKDERGRKYLVKNSK